MRLTLPALQPMLPKNPKGFDGSIKITGANAACASEADLNVGESPTRRVGLFATEHELSVIRERSTFALSQLATELFGTFCAPCAAEPMIVQRADVPSAEQSSC